MWVEEIKRRLNERQTGARLRRFAREEDGAVFIFSLQIFLVLLVVFGIAIDFVRQEERRIVIQNSIDRAALAAASLEQTLDPTLVAKDYLAKNDLGYLNVDPVVEEGKNLEYRRVSIAATDNMPTIFGDLLGFGLESFRSNTQTVAEESIGNVEVSLVLDISGSMNDRDANSTTGASKIASLRVAAENFAKKMFDNVQPPDAPAGRLSMSIVPYNQQVVLGSSLADIFHLSSDHNKSTCADIQTKGFGSIALDPDAGLQRTMYGWSWDFVGQNSRVSKTFSNVGENCYEQNYAQVMAFEDDENDIINKIRSLHANGDTGIDIGARWGLALLDPSTQPAAAALVQKGTIDGSVMNRPLPYQGDGTSVADSSMKVMILMTDGQNTRTFSTKMAYRTGPSGFYSTKSAGDFDDNDQSALYWYSNRRAHDGEPPYYRFYDQAWVDEDGIGTFTRDCKWERDRYGRWYRSCKTTFKKKTPFSISWQTIWAKDWTLQYVIEKFLLPPRKSLDNRETVAGIYSEMGISSMFSEKDANLAQVCSVAKKKGIKIFTVAVSAPQSGQDALANCSSGPSYEYTVGADNLNDAFSSIATQISTLRLTN